jgi:ELWxxDGT repeat protein
LYDGVGTVVNGHLIFAATSGSFGSELWITDGTTAGTRLVKDIFPGKTGSEPSDDFALLNGYVYFSASSPGNGRELWRSNGTEEGTTLVKDLADGPGGSTLKGWLDIFSTGSYLLFNSMAGNNGYELWRSDGTAAGTYLVKDINPGTASSSPAGYHVYNNSVLFWARTAANGLELWRTDGTENGTQLVKDIQPGTASSINVAYPMPITSLFFPFNNRLLFIANDGIAGEEIWTTDGTTDGTSLLQDINPGNDRSYVSLFQCVPLNNKLYFSAYKEGEGAELWTTDGTASGTKLFREILPGLESGIPVLMPNLSFPGNGPWQPVHQGPVFYFLMGLPVAGVELWKSDGTADGTVKVKTIKTLDNAIESPSYVYTSSGLYFVANDGIYGNELWKTDGTAGGTYMVMDINSGAESSDISITRFAINGTYVFQARNGDNEFNWDLYRLDGQLVPLPIKLENFSAAIQGVDGHLTWQTSLEANSLEFVIERSEDGSRFTRIGTVAAAGHSTSKRWYTYIDAVIAKSGNAIVYYRLQLKDADGKSTYSKVVSLNLKAGSAFDIKLLGNPVQQDIRLALHSTTTAVNLFVKDASGRTIQTLQGKSEGGTITIPAARLTPGSYFLVAEAAGNRQVIKFLKQ